MKKFLIVLLILNIFAISVFAQEFSADMVTKSKGITTKSKLFVTKEKTRVEMPDQKSGKVTVIITRVDKKVSWILMPGNLYMEQAYKTENTAVTKDKMSGEVERKHMGKEKINGVDTDKYKITIVQKDVKSILFAWFDKDGFPVKTADEKETWSSEYLNMKKGKQSASLFEIPNGYTKFTMPKM